MCGVQRLLLAETLPFVSYSSLFRIISSNISQYVEFLLIMKVLLRPSLKWLNIRNISKRGGMFTWPHVFGEVEGHLQSKLSLIGASIGALHGACPAFRSSLILEQKTLLQHATTISTWFIKKYQTTSRNQYLRSSKP